MRNTYSILNTIVILIITCNYSYAQRLEKVKGNKIVTTINTTITNFQSLELDEDFEIDLMYSSSPFVSIETDENLHETIEFKVQDSVLFFNGLKNIVSKKKLYIKVGYNHALEFIKVTDNAIINSVTPLNFNTCKITINGEAKVGLTVSAANFNLKMADKSKAKLNLTSDTTTVSIRGDSKIEALVNSPKFSLFQDEKANAEIEGNSDNAIIELDNRTKFQGKNFTMNTCKLRCDLSSEANVEVIKSITIGASGSSAVYLYQNPQIFIDELTGTSKLQKKLK